jgi:carboxylesterase
VIPAVRDILGPNGYYDRRGEDAALLIHGLSGAPAEMRSVANELKRGGFSVMCPQLAGHGGTEGDLKRSSWHDWYRTVGSAFDLLRNEHRRVFVSGLSMGALLALLLAAERGRRVDGLALLSTTFFYDGWNIPRFRRRALLPIVLYTPLRHFVSWNEPPPYGIKCERTRAMVHAALSLKEDSTSAKHGIFSVSAVTIREGERLIRATRRALSSVISPTLVVHATEDDMASVRNAHYVAERIAAERVETYYVDDSYHVLTLDRRKSDVASRVGAFFRDCPADAVSA